MAGYIPAVNYYGMIGDIGDTIANGLKEANKQRLLSALGSDISSGNYDSASQRAFQGGDIGVGMKLMDLGRQQRTEANIQQSLAALQRPGGGSPSFGPAGGFDTAVARTFGFEGGLNPRDTNGTPSNMGINAKANPDVDVPNLTKDQATQIYKQRYWDAIGGDHLQKINPALAYTAFDTAVIAGPEKAKQLLQASGGDAGKLLDLRQQFQDSLIAQNPDKYGAYKTAWDKRVAGLRSDIQGGGQPVQVAQAAGVENIPIGTAVQMAGSSNPGYKMLGELALKKQFETRSDKYQFIQQADGSLLAIDKSNPQNVSTIATGAKPKTQAEFDERKTIADQLQLTGSARTSFLANGKLPDGHVLKPGDIQTGAGGEVVAKNTGDGTTASLTPAAIEAAAQRDLAGDRGALQNFGRGIQGAQNLVAVRNRQAEIMKEQGWTPETILDNIARFEGAKAGARAAGTMSSKLDILSGTVAKAADFAAQLSDKMPRGEFVPLNKLQQMGQRAMSDKNLAEFDTATNTLVQEYARAVGGGVGTDASREHAREMLNTAQSPEAFRAVTKTLIREVQIAHSAARARASEGAGMEHGGGAATAPAGGGSGAATPSAPAGKSGVTSSGIKWSLD